MGDSTFDFDLKLRGSKQFERFDKLKRKVSKRWLKQSVFKTREIEDLILESVDLVIESVKVRKLRRNDILESFARRFLKKITQCKED